MIDYWGAVWSASRKCLLYSDGFDVDSSVSGICAVDLLSAARGGSMEERQNISRKKQEISIFKIRLSFVNIVIKCIVSFDNKKLFS